MENCILCTDKIGIIGWFIEVKIQVQVKNSSGDQWIIQLPDRASNDFTLSGQQISIITDSTSRLLHSSTVQTKKVSKVSMWYLRH